MCLIDAFKSKPAEQLTLNRLIALAKLLGHDDIAYKSDEIPNEVAGAKLFFLPPYRPDLNPIEQVFAKLKALLRKAAERTVEATWKRIGALLSIFSPQECANYFRNAGMLQSKWNRL